jgi:hypothetical protein
VKVRGLEFLQAVTLYLFGTRLEPALQPWFGAGSSRPALVKSSDRTGGGTTESAVLLTFLNAYTGRGCVLGEGSQLEPALVQRSCAGSYIANCLAPGRRASGNIELQQRDVLFKISPERAAKIVVQRLGPFGPFHGDSKSTEKLAMHLVDAQQRDFLIERRTDRPQ